MRNLFRQGKRRAFHLYQVRSRGEICFEDICGRVHRYPCVSRQGGVYVVMKVWYLQAHVDNFEGGMAVDSRPGNC